MKKYLFQTRSRSNHVNTSIQFCGRSKRNNQIFCTADSKKIGNLSLASRNLFSIFNLGYSFQKRYPETKKQDEHREDIAYPQPGLRLYSHYCEHYFIKYCMAHVFAGFSICSNLQKDRMCGSMPNIVISRLFIMKHAFSKNGSNMFYPLLKTIKFPREKAM